MSRFARIAVFGLALGLALAAGSAVAGEDKTTKDPHEGLGAAVPADDIKVDKAKGKDAYTVADLYAQSATLDKKTVTVRGKVVKVSARIMDRNWIHLRDGSGDAAKKTNNLVVTSQDLPKVGDVVTATGTLAKDKDFGMGYRYAVIVEEAKIKK